MGQPPGTVSRILWHFTGGPPWNSVENRQGSKPKPREEAYGALLSILKSRELLLGQYRELVKVDLPKLRRHNKQTRKMEQVKSTTVTMTSSQVCCLSDIPVAHLSYHAKRYGKFAIGFHRDAAVRHGFNPVFYTLHKSNVLRSVRRVFVRLRQAEGNSIDSIASDIGSIIQDLEELECDGSGDVERNLGRSADELGDEARSLEEAVSSARKHFSEFLAFVKTFDNEEFSSIYCEREWRSTKSFAFTVDDLAMIVLPKGGSGTHYFNEFVDRGRSLKLPRSIPVVPWEDLVEH